MKRLAYTITALLICTLWACDIYNDWTVNPDARLAFSSDTISFDTLISNVGSSTRRLLVFNRNSAGIRISDVRLKQGSDSHFRINVDGQYLRQGTGQEFEIHRRDSMFVLVEVKLPETDADTITTYTDSLAFLLESGEIQYVTLLAGGRDAYHWYGTIEIQRDTTIQAGRPVVIYDSVHVARGTTLTLAPGAELMFHHKAVMRVDGSLVADGTAQSPVIMRGDRTDNLFSYLPYDNTPEQWGGLYLSGGPHKLEYLDHHASKFGIMAEDCNIQMNNCILRNSRGNGLTTRNCTLTAVNTEISNTMGDLYSMTGGSTDMIHCTLAQYYNYDARRGMALHLSDYAYEYGDTMYYQLRKAWFRNCVIAGYDADVLMGNFIGEKKYGHKLDYLFSHCYMCTDSLQQKDDSQRFVANIFEHPDSVSGGDNYILFDTYARRYDFTPDTVSRIRARADATLSAQYPVDRLGHSRTGSGGPDIGAYQLVMPAKSLQIPWRRPKAHTRR